MSFLARTKDVFEKAYQEHVFIAQKPTIYEEYRISLHSNDRYHVTMTELLSYKNDCDVLGTLNPRVAIFILLYKCPSSVNSLYLAMIEKKKKKSFGFASNFYGSYLAKCLIS